MAGHGGTWRDMAGHGDASRGQIAYAHHATSDARPARALDRTAGLVQFVGNRSCTMAPLRREGPVLSHGVLVLDREGFVVFL